MIEQKKYPFYDKLKFFWEKKTWLVLIPITFAIIGVVLSFLWPKEGEYIGKSTVFTGSINLLSLSDPEHVASTYGDSISGNLDVFVPNRNYIETTVHDDDPDTIEKELAAFDEQLTSDLLAEYEKRKQITEDYVVTLEGRVESLTSSIEQYQSALDQATDVTETSNYTTLLTTAETQLSETTATLQRVKNDLAFFESPALVSEKVAKVDRHTLELGLGGFMFGLLVAFFVILLWQYISEAKRGLSK